MNEQTCTMAVPTATLRPRVWSAFSRQSNCNRRTVSYAPLLRLPRCCLLLLLLLFSSNRIIGTCGWSFRQRLHRQRLVRDNPQQQQDVDEHFMQVALDEARRGGRRGEVPIGAVVVRSSVGSPSTTSSASVPTSESPPRSHRILSRAHNEVECSLDATAHAEMLALRRAASKLGNWRLSAAPNIGESAITLYSTVEPCNCCWAAAHAFRVNRIVYGAPDLRLGALTRCPNDNDILKDESPTFADSTRSIASNHTTRACNNDAMHLYHSNSLLQHPFHRLSEIRSGLHRDECADLLKDFFVRRRKQSKQRKKKTRQQTMQKKGLDIRGNHRGLPLFSRLSNMFGLRWKCR